MNRVLLTILETGEGGLSRFVAGMAERSVVEAKPPGTLSKTTGLAHDDTAPAWSGRYTVLNELHHAPIFNVGVNNHL